MVKIFENIFTIKMLRVDTVYGNDNSETPGRECVYKTLDRAITVSKSGDTISLPPGIFDTFNISSKTINFELKIVGSGNNSVCLGAIFNGLFNFNLDNVKCNSLEIRSSGSRFNFNNVRFVAINTIDLYRYRATSTVKDSKGEERKDEKDEPVYITFEKCLFDYNFQIVLREGDYVLSFIGCEFVKSNIPLIYTKKGSLKVNLTGLNFEHTLINNDKATVEYSHVSCNFPPDIPFYIGSLCMDKSRETIQASHIGLETPKRTRSLTQEMNAPVFESNEYQKEREGAISFSSNDFEQIKLRKYTKLVNNTGEATLNVILADEVDNGHQVTIVSENAPVIIDGKTYNKPITVNGEKVHPEPCLMFGFIYDYGWIKIPILNMKK